MAAHRSGIEGNARATPKLKSRASDQKIVVAYCGSSVPEEIWLGLRFAATADAERAMSSSSYALLNYIISLEVLFAERDHISESDLYQGRYSYFNRIEFVVRRRQEETEVFI